MPSVSLNSRTNSFSRIGLGGEAFVGTRSPDGRPLHQEDIDVLWRAFDHRLEQLSLAAVGAKVAGIEDPFAARLNEKGIGIERAVIDEIGRDPERTDFQRFSVGNEARVLEGQAIGNVRARGLHDVVRGLADPDRNVRAYIPGEAVMVLGGDERSAR